MALALAILMIPLYFLHDPSKADKPSDSLPIQLVLSEDVSSSVKQQLYVLFVGPGLVFLLALLWYFTYYYHLSFMSRYLMHQAEKNSRIHALGKQQLEDRGYFFLSHKAPSSAIGMDENVSSYFHGRSRSMIRLVEDNDPVQVNHEKSRGIFGAHRNIRFSHHFSKHEEEWDRKRNTLSEDRMRARGFSKDQSLTTISPSPVYPGGGGGKDPLGGAPTSDDGGNDNRVLEVEKGGQKIDPLPPFSARGERGNGEPIAPSSDPFGSPDSNFVKKSAPSFTMHQKEEQMTTGFWSNENKVLLWLCCDEVHEAQAIVQRVVIDGYRHSLEDFMDAVSSFLSRTA